MDTKHVKTMFVRTMYIMVILAVALSVTGSASAQEPNPWLIAFPENEAVEGWEWPEGATVYLTINNAPGLEWSGTAEVTTWGDPRTYVRFEFWEDHDLQVGDEVTLTDGTTTITHIVQNLSVTAVNVMYETVTGTADTGAVVQVWPHGYDQDYTLEDTAEGGSWQTDFAALGFDLVEGIGGRSQILVDGNATAVDWEARQTYDIYTYNPLTGTIQQITYLANTDEYNPSWSPNGKKIAHDVVSGDSQSIYITNVKTGVSAPLVGAEDGGNDAVWSPNGKLIAFDRHWVEEIPGLYIVPSTGGIPTLVRSDAISADWAPNGKRLVFQQPNDNSVRTVALDGGGGVETLIAESGANPVWSPDGNWIAYENNGDIWKVAVNIHGVTLGEPVQVTSGPFWDGQPTWSADSLTIVYHSGFTGDWDIWTVPAAGGMPTWLTGTPEFGDYDPSYAKNSPSVAYASFSPAGQSARTWAAAYTYDRPAGTWTEGGHSYYFESAYTIPEPGGVETTPVISFTISNDATPDYDGYVLLRPLAVRAQVDGVCPAIDAILRLDQATRFLYGWVTDSLMTYAEALAHFDSMTVKAYWDDGMSADLVRHEIFPLTSPVDWPGYVCTFTAGPPAPRVLVQITDNWFEAQNFTPNAELTFSIYDTKGGEPLLGPETIWSDGNGTVGIWVGDRLDLQPGQYLVVSDGAITKDIVLEPITFDLFDLTTGHVEGTAPAPFGRTVWIGIGFPDAGWERWTTTDEYGNWGADFDASVPANFEWVAAQVFDADGDVSEVRPGQIIGLSE